MKKPQREIVTAAWLRHARSLATLTLLTATRGSSSQIAVQLFFGPVVALTRRGPLLKGIATFVQSLILFSRGR